MKLIPLTQGKFAEVDDEDYERVNKHKWCLSAQGYAVRAVNYNSRRVIRFMHRFIMHAKKGQQVDHIDMIGTRNLKSNMRLCSISQNRCNRKKTCRNKSGYKGVSKYYRDERFLAQIKFKGKAVYLGLYETPQEASLAYQKAAKELHGEFANW